MRAGLLVVANGSVWECDCIVVFPGTLLRGGRLFKRLIRGCVALRVLVSQELCGDEVEVVSITVREESALEEVV